MAVFDPKQVSVIINDYRVQNWADGNDVIIAKFTVPHGELKIGAGGDGVFVQNPNESGVITLKILQHSADNAFLDSLRRIQRQAISTFVPLALSIKDLLNEDQVTASMGYFTTPPEYNRGATANPVTWTIEFESMAMRLERGMFN